VGIMLTVAAGCGDKETRAEESPAAPTLSVSVPAPAPAPAKSLSDPRAEAADSAIVAYRGMWRAYEAATREPDPGNAELRQFATAAALKTLTNGLKSLKDRGLKGTGSITVSPGATAFAPADKPTSVSITDCLDDGASRIVRTSPGPPYEDKPGGLHRTLATVKRQNDGAWKVTSFGVRAVGTC
jgi:hypothetical protein